MLCGLAEALDHIHSEPTVIRTLFVYSEKPPMRADDMFDMFTIHYSASGSNNRKREEAASMLWYHILEVIENELT